MKSIAGWIGQVVSWLVIFAVLGVLAICVLVPRLGGGTPYTILTGSMASSYPPGTLVVVRPTPIDEIAIGDVITYQLEPGKPAVATHRVIGEKIADDGSTRLLTQGDDNSAPDLGSVRAEQIRGTLWYAAPYLGRANQLLDRSQHQAAVVAVGSGLVIYAAFMLVSAAVDVRRPAATERPKQDVAA
ncbi:signal peptidase I [Aeromicrobium stalagmiti]|uniref:signal peptidase I n=1 Tax=Aeromicrobium stalagmiti TaxID=2738988 RepID=UPI00156A5BE7|nr:signal peptidase I [Aeromicrobium stalagmiti]